MHQLNMNYSMAASLAIHIAILGFLFWPANKLPVDYELATVDLFMGDSHGQAPQKERKMKTRKAKMGGPEKSPKDKAPPAKRDSEGKDTVQAKEVRGNASRGRQLRAASAYAKELQRYIERNRFYPRRAMVMEKTGTVKIRLVILQDGTFSVVEIAENSQHPILNRAAYKLVTELKSFKPLPRVYKGRGEFIVPIRYQLQGGVF